MRLPKPRRGTAKLLTFGKDLSKSRLKLKAIPSQAIAVDGADTKLGFCIEVIYMEGA